MLMHSGCEPLGVQIASVRLNYPAATAAPLTVRQENAKPGSPDWELTNPSGHHEIEGYASATSVDRGEAISLFVNTAEPSYTIEVFRMGWYGGTGARKIIGPILQAGVQQPPAHFVERTGLIECEWRDPYVLRTSNPADATDWVSGIYVAKLTALSSGKQAYIMFVVRDDARPSDLIFQSSVTTFQAYNNWGGRSLYTRPVAHLVSFNRPYAIGYGAAEFLGIGAHWEYNMLRFLEREGYDVTYSTDIDTHARGQLLLSHKAFLSVGHDEYWTWEMRDNVEGARDHGVSLGFFGANISYWQIRLENSPFTGAANRTIVCYRHADYDPLSGSADPALARRVTVLFRNWRVARPEDAMIGVMYYDHPVYGDIVVSDESNWVYEGTGLRNGDRLPGMLGYEVDRVYKNAPAGTKVIGHSPYRLRGKKRYADMIEYSSPPGPTVFATGSIYWSYGLDDFRRPEEQLEPSHPAAQQIARNVLKRFGADPHP